MKDFLNFAAWLSFAKLPNHGGLDYSLQASEHRHEPTAAQSSRQGVSSSLLNLHTLQRSRTVSLSMIKQIRKGEFLETSRGVYKRQTDGSTVGSSLHDMITWSVGGSYYVSITVGTPPQNITAILDTGSADLYLDSSSAPACQDTNSQYSCRGGSYDASKSSTYHLVGANQFNSTFGDGTNVSGDFATDTVAIGDVALKDVQFGVANKINSTSGYAISLMGVGYSYIESSEIQYPNMPELLHQTGAIQSRLYSVFLNDVNAGTGTLLFGGIDTAKFTGPLTTLNLLPMTTADASGESTHEPLVTEFVTTVTSVSTVVDGKTTSLLHVDASSDDALPVLFDSGSSAWTVPQGMYDSIVGSFNGAVDSQNNIACSHQNDNVQLKLEFGGLALITVKAADFIVPFFDPVTNEQYKTNDDNPLCAFMLQPDANGDQARAQGFLTLGDAVLRSMYVVYDLENGQISIAQAARNSTGSNVRPVPAGLTGVAQAVGSNGGKVITASSNPHMVATEYLATRTISASTISSTVGAGATGSGRISAAAAAAATGAGAGHGPTYVVSGSHKSASVPVSVQTIPGYAVWLLVLCLGTFGLIEAISSDDFL